VPAPLGTGGIHTVTGALSDEAPLELGERAPEDMTVRRQPTRSRAPVPVTLRDGFEAGQIGHDATIDTGTFTVLTISPAKCARRRGGQGDRATLHVLN
jgi:hypothetical protein